MFIAMMLGLCKAYKNRRQHCKYKCLYKSNKYLEHIYKYGKKHYTTFPETPQKRPKCPKRKKIGIFGKNICEFFMKSHTKKPHYDIILPWSRAPNFKWRFSI